MTVQDSEDQSEPDEEELALGDERTVIERTDVGVSITTELKRGTGTRDQDKHVLKAKGHTLEEAVEQHSQGLAYVEDEVVQRARDIQPETGGDADAE